MSEAGGAIKHRLQEPGRGAQSLVYPVLGSPPPLAQAAQVRGPTIPEALAMQQAQPGQRTLGCWHRKPAASVPDGPPGKGGLLLLTSRVEAGGEMACKF